MSDVFPPGPARPAHPSRKVTKDISYLISCVLVLLTASTPAWAQEAVEPRELDLTAALEHVTEAAQLLDDLPAHDVLPEAQAETIPPVPSTIKGAIADSLRLLLIEHSIRIGFQEKTRRELGGNFWRDYVKSVKMPTTWEDGDSWLVNYLGHPIHGAASGFIWLDHEDGAHDPALGFSWKYWSSRGRATAWMAVYSYQFEFGPLSEASIGNVGLRERTTGWVDHVVTPAGGLGILVAEDALDRFLIRRIESWTGNRFYRAAARMLLNPSRTLSNTAQGRVPWHRAVRPIGH